MENYTERNIFAQQTVFNITPEYCVGYNVCEGTYIKCEGDIFLPEIEEQIGLPEGFLNSWEIADPYSKFSGYYYVVAFQNTGKLLLTHVNEIYVSGLDSFFLKHKTPRKI